MPDGSFDKGWFRRVLGNYPTGVAVVTAPGTDGPPAGMAVGSFTAASLDPPLVAFLPDKSSTSFPKIRAAGCFCVNVLASDQESVCRAFAAKAADKFAHLSWRPANSGSPILDGVVAWIDCDIEHVGEAGDHYVVLGRVRELDVAGEARPLLFFQGGYGRFSAPSLLADADADLLGQLQIVDVARPAMERLSAELDVECLAVGQGNDEIVFVAGSGRPSDEQIRTRVGLRMPFAAPLATPLVAWEDEVRIRAWINRLGTHAEANAASYRQLVDRTRERGWSLVLGSPGQIALERTLADVWHAGLDDERLSELHDAIVRVGVDGHEPAQLVRGEQYDVRYISAPVFGPDGRVVLMLTLYGLPDACGTEQVGTLLDGLLKTTAEVSGMLANR